MMEDMPRYRYIKMTGTALGPNRAEEHNPTYRYHYSLKGEERTFQMAVHGPIIELEEATDFKVSTVHHTHSITKDESDSLNLEPNFTLEIPYRVIIRVANMKKVVRAVRRQIHDFALSMKESSTPKIITETPIHTKNLISEDIFVKLTPTNDFGLLVDEINRCYGFGCYTAAGVLSRKLVENFLYSVLERAYKNIPAKKKKIYNEHENRQEGFSILIKVFNSNYNEDFREYGGITKKRGIDQHIQILNEIKDDLDMATHNLPIIFSEKDISKITPKLEKASKFLRRIWDKMP
jgi:hypothetical protein